MKGSDSGGAGRKARRPAGDEPRHAPRRGLLARLLGPLHITGAFWYRAHAWGSTDGRWFMDIVRPLFIAFFFVTLRGIRRAIAHNLRVALGPCGWWRRQRRIWRTFHAFGWSQTERYERLLSDVEFKVEVEGMESWLAATAGGRGAVLVTGHVGNWEMASKLPEKMEKRHVHVVREEELDPEAQAFLEERLQRISAGYTTHFASDMDPRLGLRLREALMAGEIVALQGDRPRRGGSTVTTQLFGRPFEVPAGPMALARQAGVALLPAFVFRLGLRHYLLRFGEPIEVPRDVDRRVAVPEAAQRVTAELERAILFRPHQWFAFRELWE